MRHPSGGAPPEKRDRPAEGASRFDIHNGQAAKPAVAPDILGDLGSVKAVAEHGPHSVSQAQRGPAHGLFGMWRADGFFQVTIATEKGVLTPDKVAAWMVLDAVGAACLARIILDGLAERQRFAEALAGNSPERPS
jgi:hypothetical protein